MEQQEIQTSTLREWLSIGKKVTIIDIRPTKEREEWYIPSSIHIDVYDGLKNGKSTVFNSLNLDKHIPIVTVCAGGKTSLIASNLLKQAGYEAYSLQGGMKAWTLAWNIATITFETFEVIQFRRTGKGCLSYLIISGNEAMIIDASLPIEVYQQYLTQRNLKLKYTVDTHIHADHLSRTKKLAEYYHITPSMPTNDLFNFSFNPIDNDSSFNLGDIIIKSIHTPGHTKSSFCFFIQDKVLFTGDTLFTNSIGRPDLKANKEEVRERAKWLYNSIHSLKNLHQSIVVMPGHTSTPVAFDQKPIQARLQDILANINLIQQSENEFVKLLSENTQNPPENYLNIIERNIAGDFTEVNCIDLEAGANRCALS